MNQHEERLAVAALFAEQLAKARHIIATTEARIAASDAVIDQMAQALAGREIAHYEVTKGSETVHRHTEPTAPRWPLTVATDGERNGRLAWVPGL